MPVHKERDTHSIIFRLPEQCQCGGVLIIVDCSLVMPEGEGAALTHGSEGVALQHGNQTSITLFTKFNIPIDFVFQQSSSQL